EWAPRLTTTRSLRPLLVKSPAARVTDSSREVTAGVAALVSRPYRAVPARKRSLGLKEWQGSLGEAGEAPPARGAGGAVSTASPLTSTRATSEGASPVARVIGELNVPSGCWNAT